MSTIITLTPLQLSARDLAIRSLLSGKDFVLAGYAGTGKTTLLHNLLSQLRSDGKRVAVMAPTGKAAQVLRNKDIPASTIHSALYKKISDFPLKFDKRTRKDVRHLDYFIVDESSMIDKILLKDLRSFNKPILFVGDAFQLPPVGDDPGLLTSPDIFLDEVHRQALDNPIIALATYLRSEQFPNIRNWHNANRSQSAIQLHSRKGVKINPTTIDQTIVGFNETKYNVNRAIRNRLGLPSGPYPVTGDRLICLRNNHEDGLFNGQQFIALSDMDDSGEIEISDPDTGDQHIVCCHREVFTISPKDKTFNPKACPRDVTPLDFSYAITCHKSQGSEFPVVAIIDEAFDKPARWRYTAITRASQSIHYFL